MRYYVGNGFFGDGLFQSGVKGMKKGVRRYQNPDGSLTDEGYVHYGRNKPQKKKKGLFGFLNPKKKKARKVKEEKVVDEETVKRGKKIWQTIEDDKLVSRTNRIKKENDYLKAKKEQRELTAKKKKELSKGGEIVVKGMMDTLDHLIVNYQKSRL